MLYKIPIKENPMPFSFETGNDPEPTDPEGIDAAYGFSIGEVVMYKGMIQGKIVEFGQQADVVILPWDPDLKQYSGSPMRVAVNECE
jgi:hypothetical protein